MKTYYEQGIRAGNKSSWSNKGLDMLLGKNRLERSIEW